MIAATGNAAWVISALMPHQAATTIAKSSNALKVKSVSMAFARILMKIGAKTTVSARMNICVSMEAAWNAIATAVTTTTARCTRSAI